MSKAGTDVPIKRTRARVQHFVAEPGTLASGGDFVERRQSKRKGKPSNDEWQAIKSAASPLRCAPEDLLHSRVKVQWEATDGQGAEDFMATIESYQPQAAHPFHIEYDDGDEEDGTFGNSKWLTSKRKCRRYWLEMPKGQAGVSSAAEEGVGHAKQTALQKGAAGRHHRGTAPRAPVGPQLSQAATAAQPPKEELPRAPASEVATLQQKPSQPPPRVPEAVAQTPGSLAHAPFGFGWVSGITPAAVAPAPAPAAEGAQLVDPVAAQASRADHAPLTMLLEPSPATASPSAVACPPADVSTPSAAAPLAGDPKSQQPHQTTPPVEGAHASSSEAAAQTVCADPAAALGLGEPQKEDPEVQPQAVVEKASSPASSDPAQAAAGSSQPSEAAGAAPASAAAAAGGMQPSKAAAAAAATPAAPSGAARGGAEPPDQAAAAGVGGLSRAAAASSGQPSPAAKEQILPAATRKRRGRPPSQRTLERRAWEAAHPGQKLPQELRRELAAKYPVRPYKRKARGAASAERLEEGEHESASGSEAEEEDGGGESQSVQRNAQPEAQAKGNAGQGICGSGTAAGASQNGTPLASTAIAAPQPKSLRDPRTKLAVRRTGGIPGGAQAGSASRAGNSKALAPRTADRQEPNGVAARKGASSPEEDPWDPGDSASAPSSPDCSGGSGRAQGSAGPPLAKSKSKPRAAQRPRQQPPAAARTAPAAAKEAAQNPAAAAKLDARLTAVPFVRKGSSAAAAAGARFGTPPAAQKPQAVPERPSFGNGRQALATTTSRPPANVRHRQLPPAQQPVQLAATEPPPPTAAAQKVTAVGGPVQLRPQFSGALGAAGRAGGSPRAAVQNHDRGNGSEGGEDSDQDSEDREAARRQRAKDAEQAAIIRQVGHALLGLTRTRESIGKATALALGAAKIGAAAKVIRQIMDLLEKEAAGRRRIDLLYLVDSILQSSLRAGARSADAGPGSAAGHAYPRVVAAALPRLIKAAGEDDDGAQKAQKVLTLWLQRNMLSERVLQPELARLKLRREELAAAAAAKAAAEATIGASQDAGFLGMQLKDDDENEADDDWGDDDEAPTLSTLPKLPQTQAAQQAQQEPWQSAGGADMAGGSDSPVGSPWHQGVSPATSAPGHTYPSPSDENSPAFFQQQQQQQRLINAAPWHLHQQHPAHAPTPFGMPVPGMGYEQGFSPGGAPAPLYPHQAAHLAAQQAYGQVAAYQQPEQAPATLEQLPPAQAPEPVHWDPEDTWDGDAAEPAVPASSGMQQPAATLHQWQEAAPAHQDDAAAHAGAAPGAFAGGIAYGSVASRAASSQEPALLLGDYDDMYGAGGGGLPPLAASLPQPGVHGAATSGHHRAAPSQVPLLPQSQRVVRYDSPGGQAAGLAAPPPDLAAPAHPAWGHVQGAVEYVQAQVPVDMYGNAPYDAAYGNTPDAWPDAPPLPAGEPPPLPDGDAPPPPYILQGMLGARPAAPVLAADEDVEMEEADVEMEVETAPAPLLQPAPVPPRPDQAERHARRGGQPVQWAGRASVCESLLSMPSAAQHA